MKPSFIFISFYTFLILFIGQSCTDLPKEKKQHLVNNIEEFDAAVKNSTAGEEIVLANGIWKDVEFEFLGEGTKEAPIVMRAETPGKVSIEGTSNLKIGGSHLIVKDLYFKNGYTPSKTVIRFKVDNKNIANDCRVTNCVIEEFTQPSRDKKDHWIELWGQRNQLDHCYIAGKSNQGPTLRVFLKGNEHINNYHQINNNHFGPRPRKGGPKSETMQIGDSYTSMTPSYVNVEKNYFERCNGEVEIISSKSNFNEFKNNVFFECEGSLVLRHGNYAKIDGNVFIGNDNSEFIGGIRVINTGHWITNNYFYKLKGAEFRSPLAVMNGIPKSPLNRYNQVTDVVVAYNSWINCETPLHFSVGANLSQAEVLPPSEIRSARPERVILANNLIYNTVNDKGPIKAYDVVDGVSFENNVLNTANTGEIKDEGLLTRNISLDNPSQYVYSPSKNNQEMYTGFGFENINKDLFGQDRTKEKNNTGAILSGTDAKALLIDESLYGTDWFSPKKEQAPGKTISVATSEELRSKIAEANSGDTIELTAGNYTLEKAIIIDKDIHIQSKDKGNRSKLSFTSNATAFEMHPKGNLRIDDLILEGTNSQNTFTTLDKNMSKAYNLWLNNTEINRFKSILEVSKGSFADTISIANSVFKNCTKGIQLNKETNDKGDYNAEFVYILNSQFENIGSNVLNYYRGGYDESTIGGNLILKNSSFSNCGKTEKDNILLKTRGIVNVEFANNSFTNNPIKYIAILWGEKGQKPIDNNIKNSGEIKVVQNLKLKLVY